MLTVLQHQPTSHNNLMIWAASCLAFFGFLCSSELTVPSQDTYDPSFHLSVNDVVVDSRSSTTIIQVTIKQSKTDPFHQGVKLFLRKTDASICPVTTLLLYMSLRGNTPRPLFILEDGQYLTRSLFGSFLDNLLDALHLVVFELVQHPPQEPLISLITRFKCLAGGRVTLTKYTLGPLQ